MEKKRQCLAGSYPWRGVHPDAGVGATCSYRSHIMTEVWASWYGIPDPNLLSVQERFSV